MADARENELSFAATRAVGEVAALIDRDDATRGLGVFVLVVECTRAAHPDTQRPALKVCTGAAGERISRAALIVALQMTVQALEEQLAPEVRH